MDNKQKIKWGLQLPFLLFLLLGTIFIIRHQRNTPYQHNTGYIFGTVYHITYQYDTDLNAEILAELNKVDASLSMFNKQSVITRVNNNQNIEVNDMFTDVFTLAEKISNDTNGAFDITVAPLVNAWGFGFKEGQLPNSKQVDSLLSLVGLSGIHIEGDKLTKDNPLSILDFSAIAKGYGVDRAAQVLRSHNIKNFMVEIGGEVVTEGLNEKGEAWRIGINKPDDDSTSTNTELQDIISLSDKAIATSGNYRNYYIKDGRKIAHTINPRTGYPAQQDILSSTVMAPTCAEADAFATAFMVLGLQEAKQVLQKQPSLEAYFIYSDSLGNYQTWCSEGFKQYIIE